MQNAPGIREYPYYKGFCCHFQDETFLKPYCQLSGQSLYKVAGYSVLARKRPVIGYINAYLYSPEFVKDLTENDANELKRWLRSKKICQLIIYSSCIYPFLKNSESLGGTLFFDLTQNEETLWNNLDPDVEKPFEKP